MPDTLALLGDLLAAGLSRRARQPGAIPLGDRLRRHLRHRPSWLTRLAIFVLALSSRPVIAQDSDVVTPLQLLEPEDSDGVRIGPTLVLHPEVRATVRHDTNIYNTDTARRADTAFILQPRFTLATDWQRHRLELFGDAEVWRFAKLTPENSEAGTAGARALLELGSWINVRPQVQISRGFEQRGTSGDQFFTDRPVRFTRKEASIEISREQHKLEIAASGRIGRTDYDDATVGGLPISLAERDVNYREGSLRVAYNLGSRVQVFGRMDLNGLSYRDPAAQLRNSSGYALLGGARIRATNLLDVEAGVGLLHQKFSNPAFSSLNAGNYTLTATWTPRRTWQFIAGAGREVAPSPLLNSPAIFRSTYRLEARHLLGTRLLLTAQAAHVSEDYRAIGRTDKRTSFDLSALYRLTPHIGVTASTGYRDQNGGALGRSYSGFAASLGVKVVG
ncbi:MAG: outer membrane beta-barrel protein [Proteobacteria bacterium]|nr:outer membrane beta-barrel protein [Pseudomonadota bacterium]MDE2412541.1 outer membrane beta-barrel protein [Sphingomonadales bacterium]